MWWNLDVAILLVVRKDLLLLYVHSNEMHLLEKDHRKILPIYCCTYRYTKIYDVEISYSVPISKLYCNIFFFIKVCPLSRVHDFSVRGQDILDALRENSRAIGKLRLAADRILRGGDDDSHLLLELDHLRDGMAQCQGVTPRKQFVLCESSRLSLVAIGTTYYVVLLQFEMS